ncbi:DUF421 domain-containing protein [Gracilibacillus suaedae]|uniref:DUF421 domain-containing protein n=1 Tax=Gracilibacillus suaedae TaxID=2820273 RepID=UPI001ABD9ED7|nr:DUF421 domain-containing protein [Gracilibacillus suaedae]
MNEYFSIAIELLSGFVLLLLITKSLGKTQFSQITPFDFISALILGELVGNAVYDDEVKLGHIAFAILFWGILIYVVEMITLKFKNSRKLFEGEPNIVIHKGQIKYNTLKRIKLDINALQGLIRQQGYFSIQEVDYAIIESNGMVSVLPKSEYDTPKISDLNLPPNPVDLPITFIINGEVIYDNLKEAGCDEEWLKNQLLTQNVTNYKEVLYAEWQPNKPLFVLGYENKMC